LTDKEDDDFFHKLIAERQNTDWFIPAKRAQALGLVDKIGLPEFEISGTKNGLEISWDNISDEDLEALRKVKKRRDVRVEKRRAAREELQTRYEEALAAAPNKNPSFVNEFRRLVHKYVRY